MAHGFNIGAAIKSTLDKVLQVNLPLILYTNLKSLYDCLVQLGTTQEKRLIIDIICLYQAYKQRQITKVKWINGDTNPTDTITKGKPYTALLQLINTNQVKLWAIGQVEQTDLVSVGITDLYNTEPAAKALVVGEPIAIFYPGDGKS